MSPEFASCAHAAPATPAGAGISRAQAMVQAVTVPPALATSSPPSRSAEQAAALGGERAVSRHYSSQAATRSRRGRAL